MALLVTSAACGGTEITPPTPSADARPAQDSAASNLLGRLAEAVADHDDAAAARLAAPTGRDQVVAAVDNARRLGLVDVGFRYVSRSAPPTGSATGSAPGAGSWDATVTATWRLPEDPSATTVSARFSFVARGDQVRLAGTAAAGDRGALWLSGPVGVRRTADTVVLAADGTDSGTPAMISRLAVRAVSDVRRVLPRWRGRLVVEAPGSEADLERLIGAPAGTYSAIAAVTTTVDGSRRPGTPVHVYLNPSVFGTLGPRGSQVVVSHETTHLATRASFAELPTWLLEGFADYVALDHAGIDFATAASQVLRRVRRDGPPASLPDADDLSPSAGGLGATYEEAWTACRFLAQQYGEQDLVTFYEAVTDGTAVDRAFRTVLGTTQRDFEQAWSTDLARRAGVG